MFRLIGFAIASIVIIYISRRSLLAPRSHGFYRFFAWEMIAALFFLNVNAWFRDPFSWNQIISWSLLFISLIPLGFGVHALKTRGKPVEQREDEPQLLAFEKTSELVTSGIFRYIRHPLYSSLFFLTWGAFCKAPSALGVFLAIAATLFLLATAKADEAECIRFFGSAYRDYMRRTSMFVPFFL